MAKVLYIIRYLLLIALSCGIVYFLLLLFPEPFFPYRTTEGNVTLYAEQPLPANAPFLLDEVNRLLSRSAINDVSIHHRVFICRNLTLFGLLTRGRSNLGGLCDDRLTRNVYIRPADVGARRLLPPPGWPLAADDRPLSYFIAHEITHSLESHAAGRWNLHIPVWLWEGYADYIGTGPGDFNRYLALYKAHSPLMDPANGLYARYELYVMYLLDYEHKDIKSLMAHPPSLNSVETGLLNCAFTR
jgi:hypothetical protein